VNTIYAESEILEKADWPDDRLVGRLKVCTQGLNQRGEAVARLVYDGLVARAGQDHFTRINY